jgi:hypothetical protein
MSFRPTLTLCLLTFLVGCASAPDDAAVAAEGRDTPTGSNIARRGTSKVITVSPETMRDVINSAPTTGAIKQ